MDGASYANALVASLNSRILLRASESRGTTDNSVPASIEFASPLNSSGRRSKKTDATLTWSENIAEIDVRRDISTSTVIEHELKSFGPTPVVN